MCVIVSIRIIPAPVAFPTTFTALSLGGIVLHLHRCGSRSLGDSRGKHGQGLLIHVKGVHLFADDALDSLEDFDVILSDQGNGLSGSPGSSSSTDSMNVILGMCRHIVVYNEIDSGDIETSAKTREVQCPNKCGHVKLDCLPRGNIRRNQDLPPTTLERIQRGQSLTLTQLTVQRDRCHTQYPKHLADSCRIIDGTCENDHRGRCQFVYEVDQGDFLVLERDQDKVLL
jgi:hypothetical protein